METENAVAVTIEEALEKVNEAINRIDNTKAEIREELESKKAEFREKFKTDETNEIVEELRSKIDDLEATLNLPYYADAEFRKYSLIYLEEKAKADEEKLSAYLEEVARLENVIKEARETLHKKKNEERTLIGSDFLGAAKSIGVNSLEKVAFLSPVELFEQYKEKCKAYEN